MKKIILSGDVISLQDFDKEIGQDEEVKVVKDGVSLGTKKIKKTELFDATIVRLFKHQPNSFEWGKAGNRHKVYYYSGADGERKVEEALALEKKVDVK